MDETPVLVLNSIKRGGVGGVANNPVDFWIRRNGFVDGILGKRLTYLAEDFYSKCSTRNASSLPLTESSPLIKFIARTTSTMITVASKAEGNSN